MQKKGTIDIFLVIPKLIEQSTWGGDYILHFKNWQKTAPFNSLKVGQSYELFSGTKLRGDIASSKDTSFTGELGYAMEPDKIIYTGDENKIISLKSLIRKNPTGVLGKKAYARFGPKMKVLIKFTQAKGNSFQLHVQEKDETKRWQFKPESWYYFEKGLITLGAKKNISWENYEQCVKNVDREMKALSVRVLSGEIKLAEAKKVAKDIIEKYNPWQFVNLVKVKKDDLVDLSLGGQHHSWEEDEKNYPLGNVVYELCMDVMDPVSSIRSFDKGKMKSDGSLRAVHIQKYFSSVDRSARANDPKNSLKKAKVIFSDSNIKAEALLRTKYYSLDRIILKGEYAGKFSKLTDSFHHLFMKEGEALISAKTSKVLLSKGHSCFIPAFARSYTIKPAGCRKCEILKTFVS
jgi:mannose-6-phosphate isomerase class I